MKYLCLIYYEEQKLNALSTREWDALIGGVSLRRGKARHDTLYLSGECRRPYSEARTPGRAYDIMLAKGDSLGAGEVARTPAGPRCEPSASPPAATWE
jgi:hypothetical protein